MLVQQDLRRVRRACGSRCGIVDGSDTNARDVEVRSNANKPRLPSSSSSSSASCSSTSVNPT